VTGPGPVPRGVRRLTDAIEIDWDGAGHVGRFVARALRLACPCAACVDEMTGRPLLDPASVPADVHPVAIGLVGAYAIRVQWSDGHGSGIYTFRALREQCPCAACRANPG
jgi:ATP-binding protein involved in chromosome partitioning